MTAQVISLDDGSREYIDHLASHLPGVPRELVRQVVVAWYDERVWPIMATFDNVAPSWIERLHERAQKGGRTHGS